MKPASGEQQDHLFEDTKNVLENFNPSHLQPLFKPSEGSNSDIYNTQAALFCMPRKGNEFTGVLETECVCVCVVYIHVHVVVLVFNMDSVSILV